MKGNSDITCWIAAGFLALILVILPANCFAGVAVSPLKQWVEVKPGEDAFFSVDITNTKRGLETRPSTVRVDVVDFTVSPQGGLSFGEEFKHDRSAVDWISFDAGEVVLQPGETKQIKAKVSPPPGADGDYWAAIMVTLGNSRKREEGIQVVLRTASGVFVHVARRNYIARASIVDANLVIPQSHPERILSEELAWDQGSQTAQEEQALKISAGLKNDGLVTFLASGKAFLYSTEWRRMASILLHANRRRIFPGHSRYFTGVMSQPLPSGQYKLRVFFDSEPKYGQYGRKTTRDVEFSISDELARQWAESFAGSDAQSLDIKPQKLKLSLTPGRFTAARFLVANLGLSTVSIRCWLEGAPVLQKDHNTGSGGNGLPEGWLKLKSTEFTLAPNSRRNVVCSVRIPRDAQPDEYNGIINVEVERSGLIVQGKSNTELHKIPICITVGT